MKNIVLLLVVALALVGCSKKGKSLYECGKLGYKGVVTVYDKKTSIMYCSNGDSVINPKTGTKLFVTSEGFIEPYGHSKGYGDYMLVYLPISHDKIIDTNGLYPIGFKR